MIQNAAEKAIDWTEQGLVPDSVIRHGINRLLKKRIAQLHTDNCEAMARHKYDFIREMDNSAIALLPSRANEQHYEVPTDFFLNLLGEHGKYSCCYWRKGTSGLNTAEADSLRISCEHAGLQDGMDILELGCGWGSLTLWMADIYPNSRITAVSNSATQREHIMELARERQLDNVRVQTSDMNEFDTRETYDRVVSVEMFEHMRNYRILFDRVSGWLKPGGRFFMHIFCHRDVPYIFEEKHATDWMSRHFFSGGMMPSDDLPLHFQGQLDFLRQWRWNGSHYEKTANAWLQKMDENRQTLWPILQSTYGEEHTQQWWMRWRIFFMACAELFGYDNGQQWWVSHYLFEKRARS